MTPEGEGWLNLGNATNVSFTLTDVGEEIMALFTGGGDFGHRLPNDYCDYCTAPIQIQVLRNSGACCESHLEYEHWEEIFDGEAKQV